MVIWILSLEIMLWAEVISHTYTQDYWSGQDKHRSYYGGYAAVKRPHGDFENSHWSERSSRFRCSTITTWAVISLLSPTYVCDTCCSHRQKHNNSPDSPLTSSTARADKTTKYIVHVEMTRLSLQNRKRERDKQREEKKLLKTWVSVWQKLLSMSSASYTVQRNFLFRSSHPDSLVT